MVLFTCSIWIYCVYLSFMSALLQHSRTLSFFKDVHYKVTWTAGFTIFYLCLSSVYDGHEHGLFMDKLDARIRNHDREIEKMCNHHFQGFVDSITELLKVRGEAQKLKVKKDVNGATGLSILVTLLLLHLFPSFPSESGHGHQQTSSGWWQRCKSNTNRCFSVELELRMF